MCIILITLVWSHGRIHTRRRYICPQHTATMDLVSSRANIRSEEYIHPRHCTTHCNNTSSLSIYTFVRSIVESWANPPAEEIRNTLQHTATINQVSSRANIPSDEYIRPRHSATHYNSTSSLGFEYADRGSSVIVKHSFV